MSSFVLRLRPVRMLCLLVFVLAIAGCGEVDWFPAFKRLDTTPDAFSFPNKSGTDLSVDVTSDPITVTGLVAETSPISVNPVTTGANSRYSINNGTATSQPGTVKNKDQVRVIHAAAATMGTFTKSNLTIGNLTETFTSSTKNVTITPFAIYTNQPQITLNGNLLTQAFATLNSVAGTHQISIKDSKNTAQYAFREIGTNNILFDYSSLPRSFNFSVQVNIFVAKDPASTTTLTIDGVDYNVTLPS